MEFALAQLPQLSSACELVVRTAVKTVLVYSEYIAAYVRGLHSTTQYGYGTTVGGGRCVRRDSSDQKYASTSCSLFRCRGVVEFALALVQLPQLNANVLVQMPP